MDIVSRQETLEEDNKLEGRQQRQGHESCHEHQEHRQSPIQEHFQSCKELLQALVGSEKLQKCELELFKYSNQVKFSDKRKSHEIPVDNKDLALAKRVERFTTLYLKMNRTEEEIKEMDNIKQDICTKSPEKDKSYIIKQDDGPTRNNEQQEKIKESQSNNNYQQTLFKIQASNNNPNEKTKDNSERQSLVIKLVKIAQQDDKNDPEKSDKLDGSMEVAASDVVEKDDRLISKNDEKFENKFEVGLNYDFNIEEERPISAGHDELMNEQEKNNLELPGDLTTLESLQAPRVDELIQEDSPKSPIDQLGTSQSSNSGQLDNEEQKSLEQEAEYNNNDDTAEAKNLNPDQDASISTLGRNRRVRQKNRYFSDFHCMNLAKGTRSRDDCDTSTGGPTTTRTSNRRSTTDSGRSGSQAIGLAGADDEVPPEYELKRCRKCREKTPHDQLIGCQVCAYKKIVEKHKGGQQTKSSSTKKSRSRGNVGRPSNQSQAQKQETVSATQPSTCIEQDDSQMNLAATSGLKRKAIDQTGGHAKVVNHNDNNTHTNDSILLEKPARKSGFRVDDCDDSMSGSSSLLGDSSGCKSDDKEEKTADSGATESTVSRQQSQQAHQKPLPTVEENDDSVEEQRSNQSLEDKNKAEHTYSKTSSFSSSPMHEDNEKIVKSTEGPITEGKYDNRSGDKHECQMKIESECANLESWTPEQVANFILSKGFASEAEQFKIQSIDGLSLLLMQRNDFTTGLNLKLGPALKLYDQVCKLKNQYYREAAIVL